VSAVDWLTSQPWDVFLPVYLGPLALLAGLLLTFACHRRPPEPEVISEREASDWHMHIDCPGRGKCICVGHVVYPCRHHAGQAAAALHQEAP
jgi:hypothetical protein